LARPFDRPALSHGRSPLARCLLTTKNACSYRVASAASIL